MNLKLSILIGAVLLPFISACTPDQINSAIEACKGDPECYEIIDDAIEDELASRGIVGGLMTNNEMNAVFDFLKTYEKTAPPLFNKTHLTSAFFAYYQKNVNYLINGSEQSWWTIYNYLRDYTPDIWWDTFINLQAINTDFKQFFYTEYLQAKIVIYKTSNNNFKYEIWTDAIDTFTIDLNVNRLYLNNLIVDKTLDAFIPEEIFQSFFDYTNFNDDWIEDKVLYRFRSQDQFLKLSLRSDYRFPTPNQPGYENYFYKSNEVRLYDIESNVFYNISLFFSSLVDEQGYLSIRKYYDQIEEQNPEILVNTRVNINYAFGFNEFESIFTDPSIFIKDMWSQGGAEEVVDFISSIDGKFVFPDFLIDFSDIPPTNNPYTL